MFACIHYWQFKASIFQTGTSSILAYKEKFVKLKWLFISLVTEMNVLYWMIIPLVLVPMKRKDITGGRTCIAWWNDKNITVVEHVLHGEMRTTTEKDFIHHVPNSNDHTPVVAPSSQIRNHLIKIGKRTNICYKYDCSHHLSFLLEGPKISLPWPFRTSK